MTKTRAVRYTKGRKCAVCDAAVGDSGPDSKSGEYFCRTPDCRAVRDARRAADYRRPSWQETAHKVSVEIEAERERDRPFIAELRAAGMKDLEIRREFPHLRL